MVDSKETDEVNERAYRGLLIKRGKRHCKIVDTTNKDEVIFRTTNLRDAARDLDESPEARTLFGEEFINHYIASRDWEVREHERHVTDWQMQRYFEII